MSIYGLSVGAEVVIVGTVGKLEVGGVVGVVEAVMLEVGVGERDVKCRMDVWTMRQRVL